jgi:hypothetical protein
MIEKKIFEFFKFGLHLLEFAPSLIENESKPAWINMETYHTTRLHYRISKTINQSQFLSSSKKIIITNHFLKMETIMMSEDSRKMTIQI